MGKPAEALAAYEAGLVVQQRLAEAHPELMDYRRQLVMFHNNISDLLRKECRAAEARAGYDRALAVGEPLARENPTNTGYQTGPAYSLRGRGLARLDLCDPAGPAEDTRRSLAIWDALPTRIGEHWFETACCHATLSALAGSGVPAADGPIEADATMALLRMAIAMGYRNPDLYRTESALDGLRDRDDFRLLMLDLAMPADPFARDR